jgi:hypothetical protein
LSIVGNCFFEKIILSPLGRKDFQLGGITPREEKSPTVRGKGFSGKSG